MSGITRSDDLSIIKEEIILDHLDRQSKYRKFEKQMDIWLAAEDGDNADICYSTMNALDRPWEMVLEKKKLKYSAEELMEQYAERFPNELN